MIKTKIKSNWLIMLYVHILRVVVVVLESLAGTGHRLFRQRPKVAEKLEFLYHDPFGMFFKCVY